MAVDSTSGSQRSPFQRMTPWSPLAFRNPPPAYRVPLHSQNANTPPSVVPTSIGVHECPFHAAMPLAATPEIDVNHPPATSSPPYSNSASTSPRLSSYRPEPT